jgi:hypothetical protein
VHWRTAEPSTVFSGLDLPSLSPGTVHLLCNLQSIVWHYSSICTELCTGEDLNRINATQRGQVLNGVLSNFGRPLGRGKRRVSSSALLLLLLRNIPVSAADGCCDETVRVLSVFTMRKLAITDQRFTGKIRGVSTTESRYRSSSKLEIDRSRDSAAESRAEPKTASS